MDLKWVECIDRTAKFTPEVKETLAKAMEKVYASGELQKFSQKQGFEASALYGQDLEKFMADEDEKFGKLLSTK